MTDRELLILAAAAEGHPYPWVLPERGGERPWNPLQDDGDALRLAVKLKLVIDSGGITASAAKTYVGGGEGYLSHEPHGADPYAATRRAIVRAAAAIGGATGAGDSHD